MQYTNDYQENYGDNSEKEYAREAGSHDDWQAAFNERAAELDDNIVSWWDETWQNTSESLDHLYDRVAQWWDSQAMSEKARAQWNKARADRKVLAARIEQRVTHLVENGKVKLAEMRGSTRRG